MLQKIFSDFIRKMVNDFPALISLAIISVKDGSLITYQAKSTDVDNRSLASYQADMMKFSIKGLDYIEGLNDKTIQSILVSFDGQKHVLGVSKSRKYITHIVVEESENATLVIKQMLKHIQDGTEDAVKEYGLDILEKITL